MKDILEMLESLKPECDFSGCDDFIEEGFLDSFDIVLLTSMLEDKYGIKIEALDILPENYANINAIAALVVKSGGIVE